MRYQGQSVVGNNICPSCTRLFDENQQIPNTLSCEDTVCECCTKNRLEDTCAIVKHPLPAEVSSLSENIAPVQMVGIPVSQHEREAMESATDNSRSYELAAKCIEQMASLLRPLPKAGEEDESDDGEESVDSIEDHDVTRSIDQRLTHESDNLNSVESPSKNNSKNLSSSLDILSNANENWIQQTDKFSQKGEIYGTVNNPGSTSKDGKSQKGSSEIKGTKDVPKHNSSNMVVSSQGNSQLNKRVLRGVRYSTCPSFSDQHSNEPQQLEGKCVLSRPVQRKLISLVQCQLLEEEGRSRSARIARALGERVVTELQNMLQMPHQLSSNLWAAVRTRGCQFLGPAIQEEVLKLILLALEDGSSLSRKVLVLFVVQKLELRYPQASKTAIGHVVQLLYRASCFKVQKRDGESSLMQLKEEFRQYEALRKEHDAQIVQIALEAGLRISPEQWSSLLYGDGAHKPHMQSIIDKHQSPQTFSQNITELVLLLQRQTDASSLLKLRPHLEFLSNIDPSPDCPAPSWENLEAVMRSINTVMTVFVEHLSQQQHGDSRCPAPELSSSGPPGHSAGRYKTTMCRDFSAKGTCPRGAACTFAHSREELERYRMRSRRLGAENSAVVSCRTENPPPLPKHNTTYSGPNVETNVPPPPLPEDPGPSLGIDQLNLGPPNRSQKNMSSAHVSPPVKASTDTKPTNMGSTDVNFFMDSTKVNPSNSAPLHIHPGSVGSTPFHPPSMHSAPLNPPDMGSAPLNPSSVGPGHINSSPTTRLTFSRPEVHGEEEAYHAAAVNQQASLHPNNPARVQMMASGGQLNHPQGLGYQHHQPLVYQDPHGLVVAGHLQLPQAYYGGDVDSHGQPKVYGVEASTQHQPQPSLIEAQAYQSYVPIPGEWATPELGLAAPLLVPIPVGQILPDYFAPQQQQPPVMMALPTLLPLVPPVPSPSISPLPPPSQTQQPPP